VPFDVRSTAIPDVKLIVPSRLQDSRGFLSETYRHSEFASAGLPQDFVESLTFGQAEHHRRPALPISPFGSGQTHPVVRGRIFDMAVDLRASSPTYCK